ncbi:alanyl-tRNA synthetase [Legionella busanensis]|uniref:Alanine--tRNA ligase n=1 Tax=Legionella busanensis TaxID=190655 RepID=A0A378JLD1_9GAMM|nr:alanine--tRNA ligase [Legionella busanensis]STX52035.1 alanyl-tRNA synthetase [Legionella busanensis]
MKSSEIRQAFFDFFTAKNHQLVPSSSLVPINDPTLLFTNAGMVQFKESFLGLESRLYTRAVSAQRCVRAGGKHNDLENVGYTARHHTFFEMLGNFSFGDYFKREAIQYAWEFLTDVLKLPKEKLWITVYLNDDEAANIWLNEIGISPNQFSRCGEKDNFWSMGETGPCGPCTEIFYDHGPDIPGGPPGTPEADGDRYIEIWNLVFMQFNRDKTGDLHPLPKPSVDTGMGLERIAAVVQGVHNNYEIDSFQHIIKAIIALLPSVNANHPSLKVIADHIRACAFLITDGVLPSNEGRGYVLRRIIRRAVRHGSKLNLPLPFFYKLINPLIEVMGAAYPELVANREQIERVLIQEENQFEKTLEQGLRLLQEQIQGLNTKEIPGEVAFKLYDTYGFPFDLTQDIAREQNLVVDVEGFNHCMQQQRKLSQSASQFTADYSSVHIQEEASNFHGYDSDHMDSKILAILHEDQKSKQLTEGQKGAIILDNTPFYAESGGQVGDQGYLISGEGRFQVIDTQRFGQAIVHYGKILEGQLSVGEDIKAEVDIERRNAIRLNHTATHLLHAALKNIVGSHVQQKGSLVDASRARFDFSHFESLTKDQLQQLEILVNNKIRENIEVATHNMSLDDAKKSGAEALFGEKYSDEVRVLSVGDFSKELCGGTHVKRTGDIGLFKIISEYGIASGVRRIEVMTGAHALEWTNQQLQQLDVIAQRFKVNTDKVLNKVDQFLQDFKQQEKEIAKLQAKLAANQGSELTKEVEKIGDVNLLIKQLDMDNQSLRTTLDQLKGSLNNAVIVLYVIDGQRINVVAGLSKSLIDRKLSAVTLVKLLCGKGGGRDDMAQGGGQAPADLATKVNEIKATVAAQIVK